MDSRLDENESIIGKSKHNRVSLKDAPCSHSCEVQELTVPQQPSALITPFRYPLPSTAAHTIRYTPRPSSQPPPQETQMQAAEQTVRPSTDTNTNPPSPLNPRHARLTTQTHTLQLRIQETQRKLHATLSELQELSPIPPTIATTTTIHPPANKTLSLDQETNGLVLQHARAIVKSHIRLLHTYNAIKDIGLGLMGLIADKDGRRLGEVMDGFGVDGKD